MLCFGPGMLLPELGVKVRVELSWGGDTFVEVRVRASFALLILSLRVKCAHHICTHDVAFWL